MRLIKKYKNRRLYDMEKSQYITVEELQQYVIAGTEFRVEDSTTNKDITSSTLLQILVEMESGTSQFLSPQVLRQLILLARHPMSQFFRNTVDQFFKNMETSLEANPYITNVNQTGNLWQKQMDDLFLQWQSLFSAK